MKPFCDKTLDLLSAGVPDKKNTISVAELLAKPSKECLENRRWIEENAKKRKIKQAEENRLAREWEKQNPELADALEDANEKSYYVDQQLADLPEREHREWEGYDETRYVFNEYRQESLKI